MSRQRLCERAGGGAGFLTQTRQGLGTWAQAWESGPRRLLLGAQLLSTQQGAWSPGHEGQEGDLHEDVPPENKSPEDQCCCGLRGRAQGASTMAWTPLLLPLLTLCTGAAPWPCSQAQDTQDPGLGLPGTQSAVQAPPQGGMPGEGVLPSHPVSPLSSRLRGLL